jgi:hypothetical protein
MIELMFAAALANSIAAPYGIRAHAEWGTTRPNIHVVLENQSKVKAWLVGVTCNTYDAHGALVAVSTGNVAQLKPGERTETWATGDTEVPAVRFACKVDVSEWRRANLPSAATRPGN